MKFLLCVFTLGLIGCEVFTRTVTVTPKPETNAVTHLVTTNYFTNIVFTPSAGVTNTLATGSELASSLPAPWNWIAVSGLGLTSAVLGAVARKKTREASVVPALIAGVEMASNNAEVKRSIRNHATLAGVQDRLHEQVRRRTRANRPITVQ